MKGEQHGQISEQENVVDVYNQIGHEFSNTRASVKWPWITEFIEGLPKKSNILDVGCGNGRNMKYNDYHFYGVDNSKTFINICKEQGIKTKHIELEAIKKITEKELSGNIRQLKNIIERLIILSENEITVDDVMLYV